MTAVDALLEGLGVELPVVQAGMGGGLAGHELAAAVSAAGGLGTIGFLAPDGLRREVAAARGLSDKPLAVNLLLPFARRAHFEAASEADVVVTFWGAPKRRTSKVWIHQCGSVQEALAAREAGADAVIAQGVEAGGHVRGTVPAVELLARVRGAVGDDYPVFSAGGIADASDVTARLDAGAQAVVCGTRFLMTDESGAHPAYKARLLDARKTILTELSAPAGRGDLATRRPPALRRSPPQKPPGQAAHVRARPDPLQLLVSAHRRDLGQGRKAPLRGPDLRARACRLPVGCSLPGR